MDGLERVCGYVYAVIRGEDAEAPADEQIYIKLGKTTDPLARMCSYVSHCVGAVPPAYYKVWQVKNPDLEEALLLEAFGAQRVVKQGSARPSEVILGTKAAVDAYRPADPGARALPPAEVTPDVGYQGRLETAGRAEEHWAELGRIQGRAVEALARFFGGEGAGALRLRAPCGIGKTHMSCAALCRALGERPGLRAWVLAPTRLIVEQWVGCLGRMGVRATLRTRGQEVAPGDGRVTVLTYSSGVGLVPERGGLYVFDEAHHTGGAVDGGEGVTKRVVNAAAAAGARRLFLTFTPRNVGAVLGRELNSMDDPQLYGEELPFPGLGELVGRGLLPDYRLTLAGERGALEVLRVAGFETPGARKVIVYLPDVREVLEACAALRALGEEAYPAHGGMPDEEVADGIRRFQGAPGRAWLLSCLVLLEGADIPAADTVVLLAPWRTEIRLVQLLMRAGRWYPRKAHFNVVAPADPGGAVMRSLAAAGYELHPQKTRDLRPPQRHDAPGSAAAAVVGARHVWCVSYSDAPAEPGEAPVAGADFDTALQSSTVTATQLGLNAARPGDCVVLKGPQLVAFGVVTESSAFEAMHKGRERLRTVLRVGWLAPPVQLKLYRDRIRQLWGKREDWSWCMNPRYNMGNRYDPERRELLLSFLRPAPDAAPPAAPRGPATA